MLTLDNSSIAPSPSSIPEAGTDVSVFFRFLTNTAGSFTTFYTLLNASYRFANATGGNGQVVQIGSRNAPSANGYTDTLQVRAAGNTAGQSTIVIRLEIREPGQPAQTGSVVLFILHLAMAAFREANGMSQADVAERIGVARSTISRLEQGLPISLKTRTAVEKLLSEVSPDAFA